MSEAIIPTTFSVTDQPETTDNTDSGASPRTTPNEEENQTNLFHPSTLGTLPVDAMALSLYAGPMILRTADGDVQGDGEVVMRLTPKVELRFTFETDAMPLRLALGENPDAPVMLELVSTGHLVEVHPTDIRVSSSGKDSVRGIIPGESAQFSAFGEDTSPEVIRHVRLHVVNFRRYRGEPICGPTGFSNSLWWSGRVRTEFGGWILTLDSLPDERERLERLKEYGGCLVTHLADLRRNDGGLFGPVEADEAIEFLYWLLSFANGARCSCVIATGFDDQGGKAWERWHPYITDTGKPGANWFPYDYPSEGMAIAEQAWSLWQVPDKRRWFKLAVSVYTDCTANTSGTEMELAKAHIALEMLAWVVLHEEESRFTESQLDRMRAPERLRHLLSWCGTPTAIPGTLTGLTAAFAGSGADGPHAVTEIRNKAVHPTRANRIAIDGYDHGTRFEAWWLTLWYIEMVILRLLGYSGRYENRLQIGGWEGAFEKVPWAP